MKFPRNAKLFRGQLDAAPFAGVFFLLIIFLLLNSSLVFIPGVRIRLPEAGGLSPAGVAGPSAVVAMDSTGLRYFENQVIDDKDLRRRLKAAVRKTPDLTLIVQADKSVPLELFYRLSKLAVEAGVRDVLLASRPPVHSPVTSTSASP